MFFTPRKQIRLPPDEYLGPAISFVTICCESRRIIFQDPSRCKVAIEALKRTSQEAQFSVHAYCLMPDHVHFLLEGTDPGSNLVKFVSQWNNKPATCFATISPKDFGNGVFTTTFCVAAI